MSAYIWVKFDGRKFIESAKLGNTSSAESTKDLIDNHSTEPFMIKISKTTDGTSDTVVSLGSNNFKLEQRDLMSNP